MPKPTRFWNRLAGRVAIVTGAGSQGSGFGTGKAIACTFAREGAKICLVDREPGRAEETRALIVADGGDAFVHAADVTEGQACAGVVAATVARYGRLDILVNNVGISGAPQRVDALDEAAWQRTMDVNLKSAVLMSKHSVPHMAAAGGGAIVNISSVASLISSGSIAYAGSKAALNSLTQELAISLGRDGIRVNTVAPGHIFTPMVVDLFERGVLDAASREARRKVTPLGIEGDAWDVAAAALFLASDEARFVTGVLLPVDGGVTKIAPLTAHDYIGAREK
ncbi:MAG: SDR family NAD(P)-dependent oxidoreductase [Gammaproteobacteria bacterium]